MVADPVRVWYLRTAGSALGDTLVWTLAPVYFVTVVGMSPLQLVLVGTFMELTIFVCEVPTGIVADVVSRKLSIVIGYLVMGAAIVFCGAVAQPWAVMVAWSVWGFGYTFTSGADRRLARRRDRRRQRAARVPPLGADRRASWRSLRSAAASRSASSRCACR